MVAGGSASVFYANAIAAHRFTHKPSSHGDYCGAPSEGQTYEYAKTIGELLASIF
jgi:ATP citrate (pro-S)-lyase